ncbi:hypothetical protein CLIB1444_13S00694 [[Candida] jaroonii]|uniref:Uncharacterized protein n=1 Tax=[Candida] jaroonii TaxID=467808 RepID=A0ACA9YE36_9ASCO|nr:hypothetical protein CLIB1444_13S00694 [[Candida] jaroonii]
MIENFQGLDVRFLLVFFVGIAGYLGFSTYSKKTPVKKSGFYEKVDKNSYKPPVIKSVDPDFKWEETESVKSYPFKNAAYKLTMSIGKLDPQDWLLMEPTYKKTIGVKTQIINNVHPDYPDRDLRSCTLFALPECVPAINEFYDIVVNYMCDKYPMYFKKEGDKIYNSVTKEYVPASSDGVDAEKLLSSLVGTIEEDFIILMKDPTSDSDEYFFKGGVFAFAAGFNPSTKINTPLTSIHLPIPGYEEKLKVSMNRFFNRLQIGQFVTRSNFSIQTHNLYYVDDRNKGHNRPNEEQISIPEEELDFDKQVHYRSERQVLTRLPKTEAIVFTIRTYLHPMSEIRNEGEEVCERLIGAINGLPREIFLYKAAGEWAEGVKSYLSKYKKS